MRKALIWIFLGFWAAVLIGCANPTVGPKPNVEPAVVSNKATQQHIQETRSKIKEAQDHVAKGETALEKANDILTVLLK